MKIFLSRDESGMLSRRELSRFRRTSSDNHDDDGGGGGRDGGGEEDEQSGSTPLFGAPMHLTNTFLKVSHRA